jgi:hypothetical protein
VLRCVAHRDGRKFRAQVSERFGVDMIALDLVA